MYWMELGDESWLTRVPDEANPFGFTLRRDGDRLRVLYVDQLELGRPMSVVLDHLDGQAGAVTIRVTSDVAAITPLPAD